MSKVFVIEQADFEKMVQYIAALPVTFQTAGKAVEIQQILSKQRSVEIENVKEPVKAVKNEDKK